MIKGTGAFPVRRGNFAPVLKEMGKPVILYAIFVNCTLYAFRQSEVIAGIDDLFCPFDYPRKNAFSGVLQSENGKSLVAFIVNRRKPYSSDSEESTNYHIVPFQIAYAVSIHKSQGLEFDSVKIVIADETEEKITHNIFYTAITRARKYLTIYWSPEVCNRILNRIRPENSNKDFLLLKSKHSF